MIHRSDSETVGPTHYSVTVVYAGARMADRELETEEDAYAAADYEAEEFRRLALPDDWAVYVMPHYCGKPDDEDDEMWECMCVQWLTDHHPYASGDGKKGL